MTQTVRERKPEGCNARTDVEKEQAIKMLERQKQLVEEMAMAEKYRATKDENKCKTKKTVTTIEANIKTETGSRSLVLKNSTAAKHMVNWETLFDKDATCVFFGTKNEVICFKGKDLNWIKMTQEVVE
jgi:PAB1-binding protein PBP1